MKKIKTIVLSVFVITIVAINFSVVQKGSNTKGDLGFNFVKQASAFECPPCDYGYGCNQYMGQCVPLESLEYESGIGWVYFGGEWHFLPRQRYACQLDPWGSAYCEDTPWEPIPPGV